jgi:hypothetical protein
MKVTVKRSASKGKNVSIRLSVVADFDPEDSAAREEACKRIAAMVKATGISGDQLTALLATLEVEAANLAAEAKA